MNPLTLSIVVILGKYALDKGLELGKEVGPQALDAAAGEGGLAVSGDVQGGIHIGGGAREEA